MSHAPDSDTRTQAFLVKFVWCSWHTLLCDALCVQTQQESLLGWVEPSAQQLTQVFSNTDASREQRFLAMDLLALCLEGKASDRPQSMTEVYQHSLFLTEPSLLENFTDMFAPAPGMPPNYVLPTVMPHLGLVSAPFVDVIISYQSHDEALMRRIRRSLNWIGISTYDGKQVRPGTLCLVTH